MIAVGGEREAPFSLGTNTANEQLLPNARPALAAAGFSVDGLGMHQQRLVAQEEALRAAGPAHKVPVVSGHTDTEHPALNRDRAHVPVALNKGAL
jgi:hypothetical protein